MYDNNFSHSVVRIIMRWVATFILFLIALPLLGDEMPVPQKDDLPGSEFSREEVFIGGALWGLINGGADLYFEYGFDRMALQEISWQGEEFRLELYRMTSPLSAFGIFSVSVHGCIEGRPSSTGDCLNRYQHQLYSGNYYLSLINYSGSAKARELAVEISDIVVSLIGEELISLPEIFCHEVFRGSADQVKIIMGRLGLQNILPDEASIFEGIDDYLIWYLVHDAGEDKFDIMLVERKEEWEGEFPGIAGERLQKSGYSIKEDERGLLAVRAADGSEKSKNIIDLILSVNR